MNSHIQRLPRMANQAAVLVFVIGVVSLLFGMAGNGVRADEVSFRNDVMAVISKAGCNMGTCHGNKTGKGGLQLSIRGENPELDFDVLTRDLSGRRANAMDPDRSLILLKPTMQVPHEGGRRFSSDSPEYDILRRWIAAGMPRDSEETPRVTSLDVTPLDEVLVDPQAEVQLHVEAKFSDGSARDVTRLAVYEPAEPIVAISPSGLVERLSMGETTVIVRYLDQQVPVRLAFIPNRSDYVWNGPEPANFVDEQVFAKLRSLQMNPSPVVDDATFVRRAYLDALGILPTAEEARAFVSSDDPDKRSKLIDELLERPEFSDLWALRWSDLLRNEERTLDFKGVQHFHAWIRHGIETGKPMDQFARELVASRGSTYSNPESNYYRAIRDPQLRGETTAQLFLGTRLQCAKCHNHPFDRWTQDDYYSWSNFFAQIDYKILENNRRDRNDKHEFDGEQIVYMTGKGAVKNPRTGKPERPRFLSDTTPEFDANDDRLTVLAEWLTHPENERFSQVQVNRIWYHLLGRGLVDPIDDFRATNPPSNPDLLNALADDFVARGFDLRHTVRTIMNSRTYQLSVVPNETNGDDALNFSRAFVRRMTAEQLLDALSQVAGTPVRFDGYPEGMRAGEVPGVRAVRSRRRRPTLGDQFLATFGKPIRQEACECERSDETTLSQTFQLVSGPLLNELLTKDDNRIVRMLEADRANRELVEELYWTALSRPPTDQELEATAAYLDEASDRRSALEDITWGLVNSGEFLLRR